jgi:uncharacterized glyoxalase superfamily protein PhnB
MSIKPIPDGYHTLTPYLVVQGAAKLLAFLQQAFDATELHRMVRPDGTIADAEAKVGDSRIMVNDAREGVPPMPTMFYVYVPDTDAVYQRALAAGGVSLMAPTDMYYGDRNAGVQDPVGNQWWIATHIEDLSPEALQRRHDEHLQRQA